MSRREMLERRKKENAQDMHSKFRRGGSRGGYAAAPTGSAPMAAGRMYIGTCGFGDPDSRVVVPLRMDLSDGALSIAGPPTEVQNNNPGFVEWHPPAEPGASVAYICYEDAPGSVQAFTVQGDGSLEPNGSPVSTVGQHPCYMALDATGRWLFAANYSGGCGSGSVAVLPVLDDGSLGAATDSKAHHHDAVDEQLHDRQERPHCHCILPHPSNRWVLVADLGLSAVFVYAFDAERGTFSGAADDPRHLRLGADAGCRHLAFTAAGDTVFVTSELDCTVTVCRFDDATGALSVVQTVPSLPEDVAPNRAGHMGNSDMHLHPNQRFLYVGCRSPSPGLIAVFAVDAVTSELTLVCHESTRGDVPRNFKLSAGGEWLVVGNQESKTVASFAVDGSTGRLRFAAEVSTAPQKPCNISRMAPW